MASLLTAAFVKDARSFIRTSGRPLLATPKQVAQTMCAKAYHLLEKIDFGPDRVPHLKFNIGAHPGDSSHWVDAKDELSCLCCRRASLT